MAAVLIFQKKYSYDVYTASSGQIAINMIQHRVNKECKCDNRVFKIVFMDIQMPQMDGN